VVAVGATGENVLVFTAEILRFAQDDNSSFKRWHTISF
jgi:hypothetical protein